MSHDDQVIQSTYRRLQTGFCPAVNQVSKTGTNLLAQQAAYFKAFDAHLVSLQELASSGSDECGESTRFTSELSDIIGAMQQINYEEEKLHVNHANLMAAVTKFSETEKDRLKELSLKYLKDEKAMKKLSKRTGDTKTIQEFYNTELKKVKQEHSQRYTYFAKNYLELLRKRLIASKKSIEIAEKQLLESDAADAVKRLDEIVTSNDTDKSDITEGLLAREEVNEVYERPIFVETDRSEGIPQHSTILQKIENRSFQNTADATNVSGDERSESRIQTTTSRLSSASGLLQSETDNRSLDNNSFKQPRSPIALPRQVFNPNVYKPTPILDLVQAEYKEQQQKQPLDELSKTSSAKFNGDYWKRQSYDAKERDYFDAIPCLNYIPDHKVYKPAKQQPKVVKQQHRQSYPSNLPEIAPISEENRPPPRCTKPDPKSQPGFAVADYGCTLVCVQSYNGEGEHQLSLKSGDCVKLVKSGTRGWALVKAIDSRLQGWFPTKFLKLA